MTRSLGWLWLAVVGLSGCVPAEIEEDDLPRYAAGVLCDLEAQCAKGAWQDAYYGQSDCRRSYEVYVQELVELYDDLDCDYDKSEAGDAIERLSEMDCEDWYEDVFEGQGNDVMEEVWECDGANDTFTTFPYSG